MTKNKSGWLVYSKSDYARNKWFADEIIHKADKLNHHITLMFSDDLYIGNGNNGAFIYYENDLSCIHNPENAKEDLSGCGNVITVMPDFAIIRTMNPDINYYLEMFGVRCFNSYEISRLCNDKSYTYSFAASKGIKCIPSIYTKGEKVKEGLIALEHIRHSDEVVVKTVDGHGGNEVFLYNKNESLRDENKTIDNIITDNNLSHRKVCIQPRIGDGIRDLRVYFMGDTLYAAMLRVSESGFKANFTKGAKAVSYELSSEQYNTVMGIKEKIASDFIGMDFIVCDNNTLILNEIEDVVGTRMLYACGDYDVVGDYLQYILTNIDKN